MATGHTHRPTAGGEEQKCDRVSRDGSASEQRFIPLGWSGCFIFHALHIVGLLSSGTELRFPLF